MKQLKVLVVSAQHNLWENTNNVHFEFCFPNDENFRHKQLTQKWDFAILDETVLGHHITHDIAQQLNAEHVTPIIYLVENLEEARAAQKKYDYSIGLFNKSTSSSLGTGGLESFMRLITSNPDRKVNDAVFIFEKNNFYQKIPIQDILWIQALQNGCKIITKMRPYQVNVTLQEFEQRFRHPSIVRIHDEYLVNITKVSGFDSDHTVVHQSKLPMDMAFRRSVTQHFNLI